MAAPLTKIVMMFMFLNRLDATDDRAPDGFAGLTFSLVPTLIHPISIPETNFPVNPAKSLIQAI